MWFIFNRITTLPDIDAYDIIADNISILSNLNVSGTSNLNISLNVQGVNILNSINNKKSFDSPSKANNNNILSWFCHLLN